MNDIKQKNANCYGKMFGHNFPFQGANCLYCGVNQYDLSGKKENIGLIKTDFKKTLIEKVNSKNSNYRIHSQLHWLVDELRKDFGEKAKKGKGSFGFYLGMLKRIGFQDAYRLWREVKQECSGNGVRLFWWKYAQLIKKK